MLLVEDDIVQLSAQFMRMLQMWDQGMSQRTIRRELTQTRGYKVDKVSHRKNEDSHEGCSSSSHSDIDLATLEKSLMEILTLA